MASPSAGSILPDTRYIEVSRYSWTFDIDTWWYRDTSIYRMIRRYLGDISYDPEYRLYDPEYRPIRYLNNRRYGSIARKSRYRDTYYW